jgi:ABC-type uncharacterized transport system permease subunit
MDLRVDTQSYVVLAILGGLFYAQLLDSELPALLQLILSSRCEALAVFVHLLHGCGWRDWRGERIWQAITLGSGHEDGCVVCRYTEHELDRLRLRLVVED